MKVTIMYHTNKDDEDRKVLTSPEVFNIERDSDNWITFYMIPEGEPGYYMTMDQEVIDAIKKI